MILLLVDSRQRRMELYIIDRHIHLSNNLLSNQQDQRHNLQKFPDIFVHWQMGSNHYRMKDIYLDYTPSNQNQKLQNMKCIHPQDLGTFPVSKQDMPMKSYLLTHQIWNCILKHQQRSQESKERIHLC